MFRIWHIEDGASKEKKTEEENHEEKKNIANMPSMVNIGQPLVDFHFPEKKNFHSAPVPYHAHTSSTQCVRPQMPADT